MKHTALIASFACCVASVQLVSAQQDFGAEFAAAKVHFETRVKSEIQQPFEAAIVELNVKYTASLDRALEFAQNGGRLDDAVALKAERESIALGKGVPSKDDDKAPPVLKQLRDVYRGSAARLAEDRGKRLQPLQAAFSKSLDTVMAHLISKGKLDEASGVRKYREALNAPLPPPAVLGLSTGPGANGMGVFSQSPVLGPDQLIEKTWKYRLGGDVRIWTFNADKSVASSSGYKATWSIKGKVLHLDWGGSKAQYSLELQPSSGELILRGLDSAGKPNDTTLTQLTK